MRFDICMSWVAPMIADGEIDISNLGMKVRKAIIETISRETEWHHEMEESVVPAGDGIRPGLMYHDEIVYDFS